MNSLIPQVLVSDHFAEDMVCVAGEHRGDVDDALRMLNELVEAKGYSVPAMLTAMAYMSAAKAVLMAGVEATSMQGDKQES